MRTGSKGLRSAGWPKGGAVLNSCAQPTSVHICASVRSKKPKSKDRGHWAGWVQCLELAGPQTEALAKFTDPG